MIFEHFDRQKRDFFYFRNFLGIDVEIIDKLSVNLHVFILIAEILQTFFLKIGFGLYVENVLHVYLITFTTEAQRLRGGHREL